MKFFKLILILILLFFTSHPIYSEDSVLLVDVDKKNKITEGIFLWIHSDGSMISDSGKTSKDSLKLTFKKWRSNGTEPGIRLILYPSIPSNSDLKKIKSLINFFKDEEVSFEIQINNLRDKPELELLNQPSNNPQKRNASNRKKKDR